jgi:hypothetical protein
MWHEVLLAGLAETSWGHEITTIEGGGSGHWLVGIPWECYKNEISFRVCEYPIAQAKSCEQNIGCTESAL